MIGKRLNGFSEFFSLCQTRVRNEPSCDRIEALHKRVFQKNYEVAQVAGFHFEAHAIVQQTFFQSSSIETFA